MPVAPINQSQKISMTEAPARNLNPMKVLSKVEPEATALDKLQNLAVLLEGRKTEDAGVFEAGLD